VVKEREPGIASQLTMPAVRGNLYVEVVGGKELGLQPVVRIADVDKPLGGIDPT
jgi:hypothetical protein